MNNFSNCLSLEMWTLNAICHDNNTRNYQLKENIQEEARNISDIVILSDEIRKEKNTSKSLILINGIFFKQDSHKGFLVSQKI